MFYNIKIYLAARRDGVNFTLKFTDVVRRLTSAPNHYLPDTNF